MPDCGLPVGEPLFAVLDLLPQAGYFGSPVAAVISDLRDRIVQPRVFIAAIIVKVRHHILPFKFVNPLVVSDQVFPIGINLDFCAIGPPARAPGIECLVDLFSRLAKLFCQIYVFGVGKRSQPLVLICLLRGFVEAGEHRVIDKQELVTELYAGLAGVLITR